MTARPEGVQEILRADATRWEIGPYHGALPGPMRLKLSLDGEIIVTGEVESGFLHRGLEKAMEVHSWRSAITYADHLDPEAALFGELVFALAVEQITGQSIPARAVAIRAILSELSRVSAHMLYMVKVAHSVGAETMVHYVLRDRERVLDLFELLTGARFSLGFLRFGGVRNDVTEGFIERVLEVCELIRTRVKEYNDLFTFNRTFLMRTSKVGVITPELAKKIGLTGPNARASGLAMDVRRAHPYLNYLSQDFDVPVGKGVGGAVGDSHDRFLVRLREIGESLVILRHLAESMPSGDFSCAGVGLDAASPEDVALSIPRGEAYARIESSRGLLSCHVISDGGERPARVQFGVPSVATLAALPEILKGIWIDDLPVMLASLDISLAEADR
jgi:NADH-quinone oxidoreductase subunit D